MLQNNIDKGAVTMDYSTSTLHILFTTYFACSALFTPFYTHLGSYNRV